MYLKQCFYFLFTLCICVVGLVYGLYLAGFTGTGPHSLCSGIDFQCVFQVTKTVTQYMLNITKTHFKKFVQNNKKRVIAGISKMAGACWTW